MKRVLLVVLLGVAYWAWHERQALADFPGILSAYSAKEYCSCQAQYATPSNTTSSTRFMSLPRPAPRVSA